MTSLDYLQLLRLVDGALSALADFDASPGRTRQRLRALTLDARLLRARFRQAPAGFQRN